MTRVRIRHYTGFFVHRLQKIVYRKDGDLYLGGFRPMPVRSRRPPNVKDIPQTHNGGDLQRTEDRLVRMDFGGPCA